MAWLHIGLALSWLLETPGKITGTGFRNKYYQAYQYTGSRVLEHNVTGSFAQYTEFTWSQSAAVDASGRIWLCDRNYHVVVYMEPTTLYFDWPASYKHYAGRRDRPGFYDGSRLKAMFDGPTGIAITTGPGNSMLIYVADTNNHVLRKLNYQTGRTVTVAGSPKVAGLVDGPGTQALLSYPVSLGVDSHNHAFVLDNGRLVRKVDMSTAMFMVTTLVDGACRSVSRRVFASSITLRTVGCHSDWSLHDTPTEVDKFEFSIFCRGHGVTCGPRHHPIIADKSSKHLKFEKPENVSAEDMVLPAPLSESVDGSALQVPVAQTQAP